MIPDERKAARYYEAVSHLDRFWSFVDEPEPLFLLRTLLGNALRNDQHNRSCLMSMRIFLFFPLQMGVRSGNDEVNRH